VHSLAHPLSSLLDTHHGLANAVNLLMEMRFNIGGSRRSSADSPSMELKEETGEAVVGSCRA